MKKISAMKMMAVSMDLPVMQPGHTNRMPFSGILTRIDVASDKPPHGSNGKRIILTRAAAEAGLNSLMGMGVDLTKDFDGHDAQKKIGIITGAHLDGDALRIAGFLWAADFPTEALNIHLKQADLGFSFEARSLAVESMDADPLVIKSCVFTGAAILMKNEAAYTTTALAAAAAKENEMNDEMIAAIKAALAEALGPVTVAMGEVKASQEEVKAAQTAQGMAIAEIQKTPPQILHAVSATVAKIEPHSVRLEAAAAAMEKDGVGLHATAGHVNNLRRMADSMRAEAAVGKVPHAYHDSGSYYASADLVRQPAPLAATVKIEETAEFKSLKASFEKTADDLKKSQDTAAAMETKFTDLTAKVTGMRPPPERRTIEPGMSALLARAGLTLPEGEGAMLSIAKIDAALSAMPEMSTTQKMHFKTALAKGGVIQPGGNQ